MEIDLAGKTISRIRKTQRAKRLLDKIIIWGGLALGLVLIVVASLNLWINQTNQSLNERIEAAEKQLGSKSKIESQQVYLNSKLVSFGSLIKTHELHQAIAETVFALIPTGTSLKGFAVNETGVINLSGSVPNWQILNQLLLNLKTSTAGPLAVKAAKLNQVNFSAEGELSFDLELVIKI